MILGWLMEAVRAGARIERACEVIGLDLRTVQRWRARGENGGDDLRRGPHSAPGNALSEAERAAVLGIARSKEFRDASPKTIVPTLADRGEYVASESTFYRVLRGAGEMTHRGRARPPTPRPVPTHTATGPNQVWSWDITYLPTTVRGVFVYLYLVMDIWSRRIMGWAVHPEESSDHAATLFASACAAAGVLPGTLVLHSDNGGPMRGATLLATLQKLGVMPSYSRPRVSDDNPFSEALFRTLKYVPWYSGKPFENAADASRWVEGFVGWYNREHLHSGISYVTPDARHQQLDAAQLEQRRALYELARERHPERWSGPTRRWDREEEVSLNARHPRRHERAGDGKGGTTGAGASSRKSPQKGSDGTTSTGLRAAGRELVKEGLATT